MPLALRDIGVRGSTAQDISSLRAFGPGVAEHTNYESVALYIWGDHCYCVDDSGVKRAIAREQITAPTAQSNKVLATIGRA